MITDWQRGVDWEKFEELAKRFEDPEYRNAYMVQHLKTFLADQFRSLRGDMSQKKFGKLIDKPQSVVSRLEDESYGKLAVQTLVDVVTKLDMALQIKVVDYHTLLLDLASLSPDSLRPRPFDGKKLADAVDKVSKLVSAHNQMQSEETSALNFAYSTGSNDNQTARLVKDLAMQEYPTQREPAKQAAAAGA